LFGEVLLGGVRLAHALAASLWVGGTLVYALLAINTDFSGPARSAPRAFREALRIAIGVFVVSGAVLSAERLGSAPLPPSYFAILVVKVALGIWMFVAARQIGTAPFRAEGFSSLWARPESRVLVLGIAIYSLALVLRSLYESVIHG
jgi:putative copper export protein